MDSMSPLTSTLNTFRMTSGHLEALQPILRNAYLLDSSRFPWTSCLGPFAFLRSMPHKRHKDLNRIVEHELLRDTNC